LEQKNCNANNVNNEGKSVLHALIHFQLPALDRNKNKSLEEKKSKAQMKQQRDENVHL